MIPGILGVFVLEGRRCQAGLPRGIALVGSVSLLAVFVSVASGFGGAFGIRTLDLVCIAFGKGGVLETLRYADCIGLRSEVYSE